MLDDISSFVTFISWFCNVLFFLAGVVLGMTALLSMGPIAYRGYRRQVLRRDWRQNRPQRIVESLTPQWEAYNSDLAGVGRRCICHSRLIPPGERVLLWPETGPLGILHVAVYCETVKERL